MLKNNIRGCLTAVVGVFLVTISQGPTATAADDMSVRQQKSDIIRLFMNESVDPCEDFYEFGCGNFMNTAPPETGLNFIRMLQAETYDKFLEMIISVKDTDTAVDRKVKMFYESCMNVAETNGITRDKLMPAIEEFGSMPVLAGDQWQESSFDWVETLTQFIHKTAIMPIIGFDMTPNFENNTISMLSIAETHLILGNRIFYVDPSFSTVLDKLVEKTAQDFETYLGVDKELALQAAEEIKDFEVALASATVDPKVISMANQVLDLADIDQLQRQYSHYWDVKKVVHESLGFVPQQLYFETEYVEHALKTITNTPKRVVANYMFYVYLRKFFVVPSPKICPGITVKNFYDILTNMFYRRNLDNEMEQTLFQMWRKMKRIFGETLKSRSLDWMREGTRTEAWYKLKAMKMRLHAFDDIDFSTKFENLDLSNTDYVHNMKSVLGMQSKQHRESMHKPPQRGIRVEDLVVSPFNAANENTVYTTVPQLMGDMLFSNSYPAVYNYATTGALMAHELIHGFDDVGRKYDSLGNERDWWDADAANIFNERKQCFVNQYKQYSYNGKPLPETQLQRENIADNEGLRLAYKAYMDWYDNAKRTHHNVDADALPGWNYTNQQMFFISYAHSWCTVINSDYLHRTLGTDPHTIEKFRVNGPLSNFDEFSKVFNCPLGSPMNPITKCKIY